jgi:hypothetical protein
MDSEQNSAESRRERQFPMAMYFIPCAHLVVFLEHVAGDDQVLDLAGPFVYLSDAGVAVEALSGHVAHVAHASQHLQLRRQQDT